MINTIYSNIHSNTGDIMKKLKLWDYVSTATFLLGSVLFCVGCIKVERLDNPISTVGITFIAASIIISIRKQRCPFCKHYLGFFLNYKNEFCPYCGSKLNHR